MIWYGFGGLSKSRWYRALTVGLAAIASRAIAHLGFFTILPQHLQLRCVFARLSNLVNYLIFGDFAAVWQVPLNEKPRLLDLALLSGAGGRVGFSDCPDLEERDLPTPTLLWPRTGHVAYLQAILDLPRVYTGPTLG